MEELQSTEVLDREILEDARRKARRILKTADEEAAASEKVWEKKTQKARTGLTRRFEERLEAGRVEIMARLPLDKRRLALERIDRLLNEAAASFLENAGREKLLGILERELCERSAEIAGHDKDTFKVVYCSLSRDEAEGLVKRAFPNSALNLEEGRAGRFPGIMADSGAVRVSVSVDAAVKTLLSEKRGELAAALLGKEALGA
jgi:vacuolar-type H+-ATPase subunit E/Vma4